MGQLWKVRDKLDNQLVNKLKTLYDSRQKDSLIGTTKIKYTLRGEAGKLGFGRLYSDGFEGFENEARGTLVGKFYRDIDVVNCHPTLMWQFAEKVFETEMPECKKFCANRQEYYDQIADCKEKAKSAMFKILYGGACDIPCLYPFKMECNSLAKRLTKHTDYAKLWEVVKKEKEENPLGSFLSQVLQTEERKVLLAMRQFFLEHKISPDILAYDGCCLRNLEKIEIPDELLRQCEKRIKEVTGYAIQLSEKEFTSYSNLPEPDDAVEIASGVPLKKYLEHKQEWEKNHFYYKENNTFVEVTNGVVKFFDKEHAKEAFQSSFCYKLSEKYNHNVPLFDIWRKDANRREIDTIDFAPSTNPRAFVLPLEFAWQTQPRVPEVAEEAIQCWKELCAINTGRNPIYTQFLINFEAHLLQKPFECPRVAIMFIGNQGATKDYRANWFGQKILGEHYFQDYDTNEQFFDPYDTGRHEKFYVKLQEADPQFCRKHDSKLKGFITSPNHNFNPKGKPSFTRKNYMRLILTTNKGNPISMEQSDRRWLPFTNTNELCENKEKLSQMIEVLEKPGAARAVGEYLFTLPIGDFHPDTHKPEIEYKRAIQEAEKSSEQRFLEQWDGKEILASDFYTQYRDFCIDNHLLYAQSSKALNNRMLIFIATGSLNTKRKAQGVVYWKGGQ